MGTLRRVKSISPADLQNAIDGAEDPLEAAREAIRGLDGEIAALRIRLAGEDGRIAQAKRRLERKQSEQRLWQERLEKYRKAGPEKMEQTALARKSDLDAEIKALELRWWEALQDRERLEEELREREDQVQAARRHKESLVARARQGRSSSDFIPVAPAGAADAGESTAIETELQRLKEKGHGSRS